MGTYLRSLLETIAELSKRNLSWAFSNEYSSHVGDAREVTLNGSRQMSIAEQRPFEGKLTYDKLFWIDSDIAWAASDFFKLFESDKDAISGAYLLGNGEVTAYEQKLGRPYSYHDVLKMNEPVKVHSTGFGFLCVKQGIFESLTRPWFQSVEVTMTDAETGQDWSFPIMGEDVAWCERISRAGFELWFDPTVRVTHHKTMKLTWEGIQP